jgi:PST family polysaccharide transporter
MLPELLGEFNLSGLLSNLGPKLRRALKHVAVRNALFLYGVQISGYVFPIVTLAYLSRVLSPEKIGLIGFSTSFVLYFNTITEYGFNLTATRRIAIAKEDPEKINHIFNAVMIAKAILMVGGFVAMIVVVMATPRLRANWPLFPLGFLTVIGGWLFPMWLYQGMERMGQVAARDFISKLLATVFALLLVRHESDYLLAVGIQGGAALVAGAISLAMAPRVCGVRFRLLPWREVAEALREGWPVFVSMAALTLTGSTNIVILGFVTPASEVAYYVNASRLVMAARMLVSPIVSALYPHISHMASKSANDAVSFLRKYAFVLASPFLVISLVMFIAAPLIVHLLFGHRYEASIPVLRIMAFSPFLLALSQTYSTYYMLAFGYQKEWSRVVLLSAVLNYVLMACLLWAMRPIHAMATIGTILDVFSFVACYYFYRRNTSKTHGAAQVPASSVPTS